MATTTADLIDRVRCLYNDPKSQRFSDDDILKMLSAAVAEVAGLRPSEFTEILEVPLVAGLTQQLPTGYCFVEVEGAATAAGDSTTVGAQTDTRMAERFGGVSCADGGDPSVYAPRSASGVSFNPGWFRVDPPAPDGVSTTVRVVAVNASPAPLATDGCSPLPATYDGQLVDYALYRLHSIQVESAYHTAQASGYCNKFYGALNADYQSAARIKSGFNLGKEGTGNAQLGAQRDLRGVVL